MRQCESMMARLSTPPRVPRITIILILYGGGVHWWRSKGGREYRKRRVGYKWLLGGEPFASECPVAPHLWCLCPPTHEPALQPQTMPGPCLVVVGQLQREGERERAREPSLFTLCLVHCALRSQETHHQAGQEEGPSIPTLSLTMKTLSMLRHRRSRTSSSSSRMSCSVHSSKPSTL